MAQRKKSALGSSPIDLVLSPPPAKPAAQPTKARKQKRRRAARKPATATSAAPTEANPQPQRSGKRVAHTVRLDSELLAECRAAVVALAGAPVRLTLSNLVESALQRELERLKQAHNGGDDFPAFEGNLRAGRPIGS
jgi:hypothetical protein